FDDEYSTLFKYISTALSHDINNKYILYEYIPILRPFMSDPLTKFRHNFKKCFDYTLNVLKTHENTYDESVCRDFCDLFIAAKRKAEAECRPGVQWLTDVNVSATLIDLFIAGIETSFTTIQWLLLFMDYFEDWQQKLRVEVDEVLGDRVATMQDRPRMHCVQAFLAESLRYRTAAPIGSPRNTLLDTTIASQTMVVQHTYNMSMNEKYWPRSSDFDPGRFLDKHDDVNTISSIDIAPCAAEPCAFKRGTTVAVTGLFTPSSAAQSCRMEMKAELGGWYPIVDESVCPQFLDCPLTPGAVNTLNYKILVDDALPAVS
ncbi:unnamed protein product, partial [Medioppia subpectinata]